MTAYERRNLFDRYKQDALFRQWLPALGALSRAGQGSEVEVWHEAERMLRQLRKEPRWRESEVQFLYTELCERHPSAPVFRLAVMAVLFTCLADAAPAADRAGENPHAPVCVAICAMMDGERCFHTLLDAFFRRAKDSRGERVVLPVTDYLAGTDTGETAEPDDGSWRADGCPWKEDAAPWREKTGSWREDTGPWRAEDGMEMLEKLVANALERDDLNRLDALKLRLYELGNPFVTNRLIARIDERITLLAGGRIVTQNIFHAGANQFCNSTLQSPVIGRAERGEP